MDTTLPLRADGLAQMPLVFCVVVNWNGWQDTVMCLRSLTVLDYPRLEILVVDNASTDGSVARIEQAFPKIKVMDAGRNLGFAGGCNVGVREALARGADFVWLLNNDTSAPPDTLTKLLVPTREARVGIVGTVLQYMHEPSVVQAWGGGKVLLWMGYVTHFTAPNELGRNTFLTFASVLIRRELLLDIGLLDEGYFMYFEDSDFCFRVRRAGWRLAIAEDTAVLHKVGGSAALKKSPLMERVVTASGLRFLRMYAAIPPVAMGLFVGSKVAKRLVFGDLAGLRAVRLGFYDWWHQRLTAFRVSV